MIDLPVEPDDTYTLACFDMRCIVNQTSQQKVSNDVERIHQCKCLEDQKLEEQLPALGVENFIPPRWTRISAITRKSLTYTFI